MDEQNPRTALTPAEYWEWRCTIEELETSRERLQKVSLQHQLLEKDAETMKMRAMIFQLKVVQGNHKLLEGAQAEYDRFKSVLEKSLGQSLSGKVIDDLTFEIKDLPKEDPKPV